MSMFTWQDNYKIGNATIDAQHQQLFELANQVDNATEIKQITHLMMLFYRHVREHFQAEEELMRQHHYPDYAKHQAAHNSMLDKLNDVSQTIQSRQWIPEDTRIFVSEWLQAHLLSEDMYIGEFLRQQDKT